MYTNILRQTVEMLTCSLGRLLLIIKPGYEGEQLLGVRYVNYSNGFRWLPVSLTSEYLNLEILLFSLLISISHFISL